MCYHNAMDRAITVVHDAAVRKARSSDLDDLAAIEVAAHTRPGEDPDFGTPLVDDRRWTKYSFHQRMGMRRVLVLVATEGPLLVGLCVCRAVDGECRVERLVVHPGFRRCGLGSLLLAAVEDHNQRKFRRDRLTALVYEEDAATVAFFAGRGWVAEPARGAWEQGRDGILFTIPRACTSPA
jgi:ribosomal protein S18 acetylase RimI-like enzyme